MSFINNVPLHIYNGRLGGKDRPVGNDVKVKKDTIIRRVEGDAL